MSVVIRLRELGPLEGADRGRYSSTRLIYRLDRPGRPSRASHALHVGGPPTMAFGTNDRAPVTRTEVGYPL